MAVEIRADKIIEKLAATIANQQVTIAQLEAVIDALQAAATSDPDA